VIRAFGLVLSARGSWLTAWYLNEGCPFTEGSLCSVTIKSPLSLGGVLVLAVGSRGSQGHITQLDNPASVSKSDIANIDPIMLFRPFPTPLGGAVWRMYISDSEACAGKEARLASGDSVIALLALSDPCRWRLGFSLCWVYAPDRFRAAAITWAANSAQLGLREFWHPEVAER
jgi:hypothetical protein